MPISGLIAAALAALLGGAHCLAMCGGFMTARSASGQRSGPATATLYPARAGTIWGLVPCGLVYAVLPIALFAGGALQGAAVMLTFGLGTLPNLLAAGWIVARARTLLDLRPLRVATALLLAGFGVVGITRALFGSLSSMQGAFCF